MAGTDTSGIAAAVALAAAADVVILAVGIDDSQEREGLDRTITTLPGVQPQLVAAIMKLKKTKTVLVLFSGGAMALGPIKDAAPAIVSANYGGEMGGVALADVLYGKYNPSGKLAATMYPPNYVNQIPLTEMGLTVGPGRTHMFYTGTPEFAFGAGLSYTTWQMGWHEDQTHGGTGPEQLVYSLAAAADAGGSGANAVANSTELRITLSNVGPMAGRQTLLMFWRPATPATAAAMGTKLRQKLVGYVGGDKPLFLFFWWKVSFAGFPPLSTDACSWALPDRCHRPV